MVRAKKTIIDEAHRWGLEVFIDIYGFILDTRTFQCVMYRGISGWCEIDDVRRIYPIRGTVTIQVIGAG